MKLSRYLFCLPLLLIGCASPTYVGGYYYLPHPGLSDVPATQPSQPPAVSALAAVVGIRYPDDQQHLPWSVEVRLRLENNGPETFTYDPHAMELTTGDLVRLGTPIVESPPTLNLSPGQTAMVVADFPLPAGRSYDQFDLSSLHLRWNVQIGPRNVQQIIDFRLEDYPRYYYRPYYDDGPYPYPVFGGVFIYHRR